MKRGAIIFMLVMSLLPLVSLFAYFFIQSILDDRTDEEIFLDYMKLDEFDLKTDTMFYDSKNRYELTYSNKKNRQKAPVPVLWQEYIQVGDSIVKKKDSLQIYIYRCNNLYKILDYNDIEIRE